MAEKYRESISNPDEKVPGAKERGGAKWKESERWRKSQRVRGHDENSVRFETKSEAHTKRGRRKKQKEQLISDKVPRIKTSKVNDKTF